MTVSRLWTGLSGSKKTRLLKHGMAGHIVEMVGLSWIAKPCGKSSRSLKGATRRALAFARMRASP
jgi:hypothetical protein